MKNRKLFRLIRICFYLLAFFFLLFKDESKESAFIICPSRSLFNIDCYMCGMTRAFIQSFNFNFFEAIKFNPLVIIFYPSLIFLSIQDTVIVFYSLIFKKEKDSFIEFLINKIC